MATVTLRRLNQLHTQGRLFKRGIVTPVNDEIARALLSDPRFFVSLNEVEGGDTALVELPVEGRRSYVAAEEELTSARPRDAEVRVRELKSANDLLTAVEDFSGDGRPTLDALERLLGWRPNNTDLNLAFPAVEMFDETRATKRTRPVIVRKPARRLDEPLDTGAAVASPTAVAVDI